MIWSSIVLLGTVVGYHSVGAMRYSIELHDVKEVCLVGSADLSYWKDQLSPYSIQPLSRDNRAELSVCVYNSRWLEMEFSEAVVAVTTAGTVDGEARIGSFFVQGFSSRPRFAAIERRRNKSPYTAAELSDGFRKNLSFMTISVEGEGLLEARMKAHASTTPGTEMRFEGPIFLPDLSASSKTHYAFLALLEGFTQHYPFVEGKDTFFLGGMEKNVGAKALLESGFTPQEWRIREAGHHAKTGTRPANPAGRP